MNVSFQWVMISKSLHYKPIFNEISNIIEDFDNTPVLELKGHRFYA